MIGQADVMQQHDQQNQSQQRTIITTKEVKHQTQAMNPTGQRKGVVLSVSESFAFNYKNQIENLIVIVSNFHY